MNKIAVSALTAAAVVLLAGCSSTAVQSSSSTDASTTAAQPAETPAPAPDLTGEWQQSNAKSAQTYQTATITADTIEINWISDGGSTKSIYWAGSFTAPTSAGKYSWVSNNDTNKTASALLASSDPTKTFTYDNSVISYDVSALGTTTTVELKHK